IVNVMVSSDATGIVVITVNGVDYNLTLDGGKASVEISGLKAGTYNIVAKYLGNKYYANVTNDTVSFNVMTNATIITSVVTRGYGSEYDYEAVFIDNAGKPLANTQVTFAVNGKEYNVTTDENGVARLPGGTLSVGNHTVVSINPLTGYETHNNAIILPVVAENKNIVMDFKDGSKYSIRIMGDDGKPVGAGVEVVITVNKINYKVKTDSNGYARLSINLNPGSYSISATYKGYKVSNKLTIKQTLSAKKTQVAKKSVKVSKIKATLKWSSGKPIKGKKITMKFRGKTYSAKTNSKGIATFKLPKNAIKNIRTGKTYKVKYTYLTDSIYKYIKIKK
ncbi:MAG: Ig-like domain repeat protein, partial [Methanobrevibacter sp.]|nr:Ig-like domain repeat protein [Methanobrevibacter sp.]